MFPRKHHTSKAVSTVQLLLQWSVHEVALARIGNKVYPRVLIHLSLHLAFSIFSNNVWSKGVKSPSVVVQHFQSSRLPQGLSNDLWTNNQCRGNISLRDKENGITRNICKRFMICLVSFISGSTKQNKIKLSYMFTIHQIAPGLTISSP